MFSATVGHDVSLLVRLGEIGNQPDHSEADRLKRRFLVYMGAFMAGGGLLWGTLAAAYQLWLPAVVPYGYTALTIVNLTLFWVSKRFAPVRFVQVLISLLLPFLFQWTLGGWVSSGAVMLWSMLAIVGAMTFSDARAVVGWLVVYVLLCALSALLDPVVQAQFAIGVSGTTSILFFAINIVVVSSLVFGLMIYLGFEREKVNRALESANTLISELNEGLEVQVSDRTRELRAALGRSRAILDNMADGLVAIGKDGVVQAANPALSRMMVLEADLGGKAAKDVLPAVIVDLATRACEQDTIEKLDLSLPAERVGAATASPIHEGEGSERVCIGAVVIVRDVTLEKEIDRMKTDFIATVSHELRTPLTSVLGFAKVTKNKLQQAIFPLVPATDRKAARAIEQISGNIDIIVSEGERLTTLINDVLDISKMEAGRMEWKMAPLDPAALARHAMEATSSLFQGDVKFVSAIAEGLPQITGDSDRLLQVLINLISNASKFTQQGSVTVGVRRVSTGVELSVTDTGPGIEIADQEAIFEKFRQVGDTLTNKPKGTGLGLPICRQIVTAHKGHIAMTSANGKGSRFFFVLPAEGPDPQARPRSASPTRPPGLKGLLERIESQVHRTLPASGGGDVLVVDDDANLRELVRQQLTERGYTVRQAADGAEGIREVRARKPDLIILDVMMPGISGFDVAAVLKSDPETRDIPIVILSIIHDEERGYGIGVDRYLTKPTEAEVLADEVKRLLGQGQSPRRVLVVNERVPAAPDVVRLLEAKGYEVLGSCTPGEFRDAVRKALPDLVILETGPQSHDEIVRTIRLEKDLQHVYVVQMVSKEDDGAR